MARSTPDSHAPQQNHLLAALPATERAQICPHPPLVEMPLGKVVYEPAMFFGTRILRRPDRFSLGGRNDATTGRHA